MTICTCGFLLNKYDKYQVKYVQLKIKVHSERTQRITDRTVRETRKKKSTSFTNLYKPIQRV